MLCKFLYFLSLLTWCHSWDLQCFRDISCSTVCKCFCDKMESYAQWRQLIVNSKSNAAFFKKTQNQLSGTDSQTLKYNQVRDCLEHARQRMLAMCPKPCSANIQKVAECLRADVCLKSDVAFLRSFGLRIGK